MTEWNQAPSPSGEGAFLLRKEHSVLSEPNTRALRGLVYVPRNRIGCKEDIHILVFYWEKYISLSGYGEHDRCQQNNPGRKEIFGKKRFSHRIMQQKSIRMRLLGQTDR